MDRFECVTALRELGVDNIELLEGGITATIYFNDAVLEQLVAIVELTEKLENS